MPCDSCGGKSLIRDDVTGRLVCDSCGALQPYDNYEARVGGFNGPEGVFIRVGTSGTGSVLNYRDKKIYEANKLIDDLTFRLHLATKKVDEIKLMISKITEGEYGLGDWFSVLIGACAYVAMRNDNKFLSMEEVSDVVGCDLFELGRMIMRVVDFLNIKLPDFDIVNSFERVVRNLSCLEGIGSDKLERIRKQGIFLIQCSVKWFLTTGRRPLPVVVAVLVLMCELNGLEGVKIEQVAREVHAVVSTCRLRYRELLETLVKVAQVLPWGKNVTVKNVVKNAPLVIRYMEMKSVEKNGGGWEGNLGCVGIDLGEVVSECLNKDFQYDVEGDSVEHDYDSGYFQVEGMSGYDIMGVDGGDKLQLSHECLSMVYDNFLEEIGQHSKHVGESGLIIGKKRKRGFDFNAIEWWNGKSELSKKLLLKEILEKDVGYNAMPPSFLKGVAANKRRRTKINAAKMRISKIMHPGKGYSCNDGNVCMLEDARPVGRRRKTRVKEIDWEDFIIETLLLHEVKEEEIEKGYYSTLLDMHVFNCGSM